MGTVILDGKQYETTGRAYRTTHKKSRKVKTSLTGKTIIRTFTFTDYKYRGRILVPLSATGDDGDLDDLRTAYDKAYVEFTDQFGIGPIEVVMLGELDEAYEWALVNADVPLVIDISLVKRQV